MINVELDQLRHSVGHNEFDPNVIVFNVEWHEMLGV